MGIVSSVLVLHLEASSLTYIQRCPFNYFSVDFLAWQLILSDLSRSAARSRCDTESWLMPFQNFKLPRMVYVFSVLFHTYRWPLIEAFGTPRSFSDCTGNVLFGCRYWCGAVFWEEARNSVQRGTASFSWFLLAIEQCHKKKDQKIFGGNYFSRGKFCSKWLDFWSTCINPA